MDKQKILRMVDHTLLLQNADSAQIFELIDDGITYNCASVCIPPSFVELAKKKYGSAITLCSVIGFPNGYATAKVKCFEAKEYINRGADEIDMVINVGALKDKNYDCLLDEISSIKEACGDKILKVIVETCLLTEDEKIKMCEIVTNAKADFIKTSTGFSTGGATKEDIALFAKHVGKGVQIKAAGGISTFEDALAFIDLGATRLGTSRLVKLMKNESIKQGTY